MLAPLLLAAATAMASTVRIALVEESAPQVRFTLARSLESSSATIVDVQTLPCYYAGNDFRYRLPAGPPLADEGLLAETDNEYLLIYPPEPDLVPGLSTRTVRLSHATGPNGDRLVSILMGPEESAHWDSTVMGHYTLTYNGRELNAALIGKVRGGLPRLAAALKKEAPYIGVARGSVFDGELAELRGAKLAESLDGLGLDYAAVDSRTLKRKRDLERFRGGVTFLSANLVYSSAPAQRAFQTHAEVGDVFLTAVTDPAAARHLPQVKALDPLESVEALVKQAKGKLVVVLASDQAAARLRRARGVDLVLAEDHDAAPDVRLKGRRGRTVWTMRAAPASLNVLEATVEGGELSVVERHAALDEGPSGFDPDSYGIVYSTGAALIPPWRAFASTRLGGRHFWKLAAAILAEDHDAEAAALPVTFLPAQVDGAVTESVARAWLRSDDSLTVISLPGARLQALLADPETAVGGVDNGRVHGLPIDPNAPYRVVTTRHQADMLELPPGPDLGRLDDQTLASLRRRAGVSPRLFRRWIEGKPTAPRGLWRLNFRDVGVNLRNTNVERDDALAPVPNSRIQGFDERVLGVVGKVDAEYLRESLKWTNTGEAEYARSRIKPRVGPPVTNTTANRLLLRTMGTHRAGHIGHDWLARSWGPSLGLQFDGEFESSPGLRRKQIYSAFPGVEFYDGAIIRSLELAGNFRRDLSREPPNTQYGLRLRALASAPVKAATLEGEVFANYFFLTRRDLPQDLRVEGNAVLRLRVPVWRHFSVAPFLDFYFVQLKTRPVWGYSMMTGLTIGFSRLWKPQYERF